MGLSCCLRADESVSNSPSRCFKRKAKARLVIAVGTNVLLRYLLRDDPDQAERAHHPLAGREQILLMDVVLVETICMLSGRRYQAAKVDLTAVLDNLLQEPNIRFEDEDVVWNALQASRDSNVDFVDALPPKRLK